MALKGKAGPRPEGKKARKKQEALDPGADFDKPARRAPKDEPAKRPRQQRLPGTEDAKIDLLEDLAADYASIHDERQGLSRKEVELKGKLLDLMKANKKSFYQRDGVTIQVIVETEKVKVRIKGHGDDEPETESDEESEPESATEE